MMTGSSLSSCVCLPTVQYRRASRTGTMYNHVVKMAMMLLLLLVVVLVAIIFSAAPGHDVFLPGLAGVQSQDVAGYVDYWASAAGHNRLHPEPPACPHKHRAHPRAPQHLHQPHHSAGHGSHAWADGRREAWTDSCTCEQLAAWKSSPPRHAFLKSSHEHAVRATEPARCVRPPALPASMYSFCPSSHFLTNMTELDQVLLRLCVCVRACSRTAHERMLLGHLHVHAWPWLGMHPCMRLHAGAT